MYTVTHTPRAYFPYTITFLTNGERFFFHTAEELNRRISYLAQRGCLQQVDK